VLLLLLVLFRIFCIVVTCCIGVHASCHSLAIRPGGIRLSKRKGKHGEEIEARVQTH